MVADGGEVVRGCEADELIGLGQGAERIGGCDRDSQHHPRGSELARYPAGDPRGGTGGDAVVDDDCDPPGQVLAQPSLPEAGHTVLQHGAFVVFDGLQFGLADPGMGKDVVFEYPDPALADRTHGQLRLVGKAQLPHHNHVQRRVEGGGNFEGDRDAAAGQAQDHEVLPAQAGEPPSQLPSGVDPVFENAHRFGFPSEASAAASSRRAPAAGEMTS